MIFLSLNISINMVPVIEILLKVALNTMTLTLKHHSTNVGFLITGTMLMECIGSYKSNYHMIIDHNGPGFDINGCPIARGK
jgi:hypothetical protein